MKSTPISKYWILILAAALGYFVDVFDILLFSVVRTTSLKGLGVADADLLNVGIDLINAQMFGMLLGGLLWGVLGDKYGRLKVLFGSIALYSIANLLNGFVDSVGTYTALRFIAGFGLAGELGAGLTLVAEALPREKRGLGTTIIATVGVMGGLTAALVGKQFDWRVAYWIAGGMGALLLLLRLSVFESSMFLAVAGQKNVRLGSLRLLFSTPDRVRRFLGCVFSGVPIYFVLGILVTFAPEIGQARGLGKSLTAGDAVFYSYLGFILGDFGSGLISQWVRARKPVVLAFIALTSLACLALLFVPDLNLGTAQGLYVVIGTFAGYWAVMSTVATEQFGTNLRATVATSVPNLIRGAVVPLTLVTKQLIPQIGILNASGIMIVIVGLLGLISTRSLRETFSTDLDYLEK